MRPDSRAESPRDALLAWRPAFAPHVAVDPVDDAGVLVCSEGNSHLLPGALHLSLAQQVDGHRTVEELVQQLGTVHGEAETLYAILRMRELGVVVDGATPARPAPPFAGDGAVEIPGAGARPIAVEAADPSDAAEWCESLGASGFVVAQPGDLTVVLVDDYLTSWLAEWNARALREDRPWLLCKPWGLTLWLGPIFEPGRTACWECLRYRLSRRRPVEAFLARRRATGVPLVPRVGATWTRAFATELVGRQVAAWFAEGGGHDGARSITTVTGADAQPTRHRVERRPQCPACGDPTLYARRAGARLQLDSRLKQFLADGGHRAVRPEESLNRFARLLDSLTGVVGDLRRVSADDDPLFTYAAGISTPVAHGGLHALRDGLRRGSGGKGWSDAQAQASALGEGLERSSGIHQGDEPRVHATLLELGPLAIHPNRCMLFSDRQYRDGTARSSVTSGTGPALVPFNSAGMLDWSPVWSLTEGRQKYLPTALLYYGAPQGEPTMLCGADSNGCAAGYHVEDALLQGMLELVERDAMACWWYNRLRRPALDLSTFADPQWPAAADHHRRLGRETWVLDLTTDLGIPVFAAVSRRAPGPREEILLGLGAHLEPSMALKRALSELHQMLAWLKGAGEDEATEATLRWWLREATVDNQPYLQPRGDPRPLDAFPSVASADLRDDIAWCRRAVEAAGLEVLVLDQTRPDVDVPVVKVIVPGLRHFRSRFAPGRLFDVPVRMGWTERPVQEVDLNPIPFFL